MNSSESFGFMGRKQRQPGPLSRRACRDFDLPVLLKNMNEHVFVLDLLGKEFMRMANSVSTKFMTWARISAAPCFVMRVCFFLAVRLIKGIATDVSRTFGSFAIHSQ